MKKKKVFPVQVKEVETGMKKIKIFIGSSIIEEELGAERDKLGAFVNGFNREYIDKGYFIDYPDCKYMLQKMNPEGSQQFYDDYIRNEADCAFFLFFRKAGQYTLHELKLARDTFMMSGRPDIFIYFKVIGDDIEQTDEIKKAVDIISDEYNHYFCKFSHVDTVKLCILQYVAEKIIGSSVEISDGKVLLDGKIVEDITVDNIYAYCRNPDYIRLKSELNHLYDELSAASKEQRFQDVMRCSEIIRERKKLLSGLESDILKIMLNYQRELRRKDKNPLVIAAYELLESGKITEAWNLFPIESLRSRAESLELKESLVADECETLIEEGKTRIDALNLDVSNRKRFALIEETYIALLESAFSAKDFLFVYSFVVFYYTNDKTMKKAYDIAKRLEGFCQYSADCASDENIASLYDMLGNICSHLVKSEEAEDYYDKSIAIREKLFSDEPERYIEELIQSCNNLGIYYFQQRKNEKAEEYLKKAVALSEKLAWEDHKKSDELLSQIYNTFGAFLITFGPVETSEKYLLKSIEIRERLVDNYPGSFQSDLAQSYLNTGVLYEKTGIIEKALDYFMKAAEIYESMVFYNPQRFRGALATCYHNLGTCSSPDKAKDYFIKAIEIREDLVSSDPECYLDVLANSYFALGKLYDYSTEGNNEIFEKCLLQAMNLRELLEKYNPQRFCIELARSYDALGTFYFKEKQVEKAESFYLKALSEYEAISAGNSDYYLEEFASCYHNIGNACFMQGGDKRAEAEDYFLKAVSLYTKLTDYDHKNSKAPYSAHKDHVASEDSFFSIIMIFELLADNFPEKYNVELAKSYYNMGLFYIKYKVFEKALEYCLKAIKLYESLSDSETGKYYTELANCSERIGFILSEKGDMDKAEICYRRVLALSAEIARIDNTVMNRFAFACSYITLGEFNVMRKEIKIAASCFIEAIKILEELIKESEEKVNFSILDHRAVACLRLGTIIEPKNTDLIESACKTWELLLKYVPDSERYSALYKYAKSLLE